MQQQYRLTIRELRCEVATWRHLDLPAGGCAALAGASGSGKSRLLRAIADLDLSRGEVYLDGLSREDFTGHAWRREVIYLPADSGWWAERVGDHFAAIDEYVLALLGFSPDVSDWSVRLLSTGERSRLSLARAVSRQPRVLLLDEPTANLDADTTEAVEQVIAEQRRSGVAIIWVTHDTGQQQRLDAQRFIIANGVVESR